MVVSISAWLSLLHHALATSSDDITINRHPSVELRQIATTKADGLLWLRRGLLANGLRERGKLGR